LKVLGRSGTGKGVKEDRGTRKGGQHQPKEFGVMAQGRSLELGNSGGEKRDVGRS